MTEELQLRTTAATANGRSIAMHFPRPEAKRLAAYIDELAVGATLALPANAGTNGSGGEKLEISAIVQ